jgi:hypothetical protein
VHCGSAPDYRASSARVGKFIRQTRNAVGSIFVANSRMHRRAGRLWGTFQEFCYTAARPDRGRPCARADGRYPAEAVRRNRASGLRERNKSRKEQPAGLKPLNASRARWFDSARSSRPRRRCGRQSRARPRHSGARRMYGCSGAPLRGCVEDRTRSVGRASRLSARAAHAPGARSPLPRRNAPGASAGATLEGTAHRLKSLNDQRVVRTWTSRACSLTPAVP